MRTLIIAICITSFFSCKKEVDIHFWPIKGKGNSEINAVDLTNFIGVALKTNAEIYIDSINTESIRIEAQNNIFKNLTIDILGGVLEIGAKRPVTKCNKVKIYIGSNKLNSLQTEGSGLISIANGYNINTLTTTVEGSGNIQIRNLHTYHINSEISGSGNITITGIADSQTIKIDGSGNYYGVDCESKTADITISGSGNCEVYVHDQITAKISGSGDINYKGNPTLNISISGSGHIKNVN